MKGTGNETYQARVSMEVRITSLRKLVYNPFTSISGTCNLLISRGYNPFTKYHGHPGSMYLVKPLVPAMNYYTYL